MKIRKLNYFSNEGIRKNSLVGLSQSELFDRPREMSERYIACKVFFRKTIDLRNSERNRHSATSEMRRNNLSTPTLFHPGVLYLIVLQTLASFEKHIVFCSSPNQSVQSKPDYLTEDLNKAFFNAGRVSSNPAFKSLMEIYISY